MAEDFEFPQAVEMRAKVVAVHWAMISAAFAQEAQRREAFERRVQPLLDKAIRSAAEKIRAAAEVGDVNVDVYSADASPDPDDVGNTVLDRLKQFLEERGYVTSTEVLGDEWADLHLKVILIG